MRKATKGMTSKPAMANSHDNESVYKKVDSSTNNSDASCINNGKKGTYSVSLTDTSDTYPNREDID